MTRDLEGFLLMIAFGAACAFLGYEHGHTREARAREDVYEQLDLARARVELAEARLANRLGSAISEERVRVCLRSGA